MTITQSYGIIKCLLSLQMTSKIEKKDLNSQMLGYIQDIDSAIEKLIEIETDFCKEKDLKEILAKENPQREKIWNTHVIPLIRLIHSVTNLMLQDKIQLYPVYLEKAKELKLMLNLITKNIPGKIDNDMPYRMCLKIEYAITYSFLSPEEFVKVGNSQNP